MGANKKANAHYSKQEIFDLVDYNENKLRNVVLDIKITRTDPDLREVFTKSFITKIENSHGMFNLNQIKETLEKIQKVMKDGKAVNYIFILISTFQKLN